MVTLTLMQVAEATSSLPPNPLLGFDWAGIGLQVLAVLGPVISALIGWAALALRQLALQKTKNELLARLTGLAGSVAAEMNQAVVDAVRRASADGTLTDHEKADIKKEAMDKLLAYVGAKGITETKKLFGLEPNALDGLLGGLLEQAVAALKQNAPPPPKAPVVPIP